MSVAIYLVILVVCFVLGALLNRRDVLRWAGYSPEWSVARLLTSSAQKVKLWQLALFAPILFIVWGIWANHLYDQASSCKRR